MAAATLTGQQQAAAVLARILATPGMPAATWTVWSSRHYLSGVPELHGQIDPAGSVADAHASISAFRLAFDLDERMNETFVKASHDGSPFTKVEACGGLDGVRVKIWIAVHEDGEL